MIRAGDLRAFATDRVLRDGGSIHVRAIRPDDKQRLVDHFNGLSTRSIYFRFFGAKKRLTDAELVRFTDLDFDRNVGLIATLLRDGHEEIIGVGRYARGASHSDGPRRAEVAFAIADAHQGRGIGTVLLEILAEIARGAGIEEFEADVLGENNGMLNMFARSGYRVSRALQDGVFHLCFPTAQTEASRAGEHERDRTAAAASVRAFLEPRSVAVVGASARAGSIGAALLANLRRSFTGAVYPVHPSVASIDGLAAFPRVSAIGAPVDLAVIAVPAAAVEQVIDDCAHAGVRGVVVISSGFAELGAEGRALQERITARVRHAGMRLVGPNCLGVLNTDPRIALNATFADVHPAAGRVSLLSQSGALALSVLARFERLGIGLAHFVSVGNKADVSSNDLLAYWAEDERTACVLLHIESFGNPRKFARVAPEVARRKPIVAVKGGRSPAGWRAASSHSAARAAPSVAVEGLLEQVGVIRTDTLGDLFDVVALLACQPLPAGPRVGIVTNAGGLGILLADACATNGLTLPELAASTRASLAGALPAEATLVNPVDLTVHGSADQLARAIEVVGADPSIDALIAIHVTALPHDPTVVAGAIARGAGAVAADKPVLTVLMNGDRVPAELHAGPRGRLPVYEFPENPARALAAAERYARWRRRPAGRACDLGRFAEQAVRAVVDCVLRGATESVSVRRNDAAAILRAVGIALAPAEECAPDHAVETAERLGYPLVAKAIAPGLSGRREAGAIRLELGAAREVASAVQQFRERVPHLAAVELQRQVDSAAEAVVCVTSDEVFGPLVSCAVGGAAGELLQDASHRLPPVTDVDAEEMIGALKLVKLLDGHRGSPPADRRALADVVCRVSALVELIPELRALALDPIALRAPGGGATVVGVRMELAPPGARREVDPAATPGKEASS